MKILIVAQKLDMNDDVLGFFHDWVKEFSFNFEKVSVLCLEKGDYDLPENVSVFSLGKESDTHLADGSMWKFPRRIKYLFRFFAYISKQKNEYDSVFVHMIPLYAVLGSPVWHLYSKSVSLWYAHGHRPWLLSVAEKMVDFIFSSSSLCCRIKSDKLRIVGHGIDTEKFRKQEAEKDKKNFNIISIGRIAPIKDYETLIKAVDELRNKYGRKEVRLKIIGKALLDSHENYFRKLQKMVRDLCLEKQVEFTGSVSYTKIIEPLLKADIMASGSKTGSLDKAMLEAMSMELPVLSCNEAMLPLLIKKEKQLMYKPGDSARLAAQIDYLIGIGEKGRNDIGAEFREIIIKEHGLKKLIRKIKKCVE
jgi:glycosyltransferase involved in cell wall biosynthesis